MLAGRWWRVVHVDAKAMIIQVEGIESGKAPVWHGGEGDMSFEIMQRAAAILSGSPSAFVTDGLRPYIEQAVKSAKDSKAAPNCIILGEHEKGIKVLTYAGHRVNRYLGALIGATATSEVSFETHATGMLLPSSGEFSVSGVDVFLKSILTDGDTRRAAEERALRSLKILVFWQIR